MIQMNNLSATATPTPTPNDASGSGPEPTKPTAPSPSTSKSGWNPPYKAPSGQAWYRGANGGYVLKNKATGAVVKTVAGGTKTGGGTTTTTGGGKTTPLQGAQQWATQVLGGNFSNLPMYQELTDPKYSDPTTNPYIQSMVGGLQDTLRNDWLANMSALNEQAEAGGRYGSGTYLAGARNATQATESSLANAISQMYSGAYENERQRRAGLASQFLGAQESAANIPVSIYGINQQSKVGMAGVGVQRGQLSLARSEFNFNKQMQTAAAQQDALNDYFNLLAGIGGLGGTQVGTTSGTSASYIPPSNAAITGAIGGIVNHYA